MFIEQPARGLRWLYPAALWRMNPDEHAVYLTFDDGPIPESTPFILDTLRKYGIKATFFMVGENVLHHPDLYQQIVAEGHQVGNHTFNHLGAFKHWTITYAINTEKANRLIGAHLFRPPHGWMRHSEYWWAQRKYKIVMWDLVTRDYSKWLTADDVVLMKESYSDEIGAGVGVGLEKEVNILILQIKGGASGQIVPKPEPEDKEEN